MIRQKKKKHKKKGGGSARISYLFLFWYSQKLQIGFWVEQMAAPL